jgi:hypothetical protein
MLNSSKKHDYGYLRLCADLGPKAASVSIEAGFPSLPEDGSDLQFLLLPEWLKVCDEGHDDRAFAKEDKPLPTTVLDVRDPERLRL